MKFVKRISLFFLYPLMMFALGIGVHGAVLEYFYPGSLSEEDVKKEQKAEENVPEEPLNVVMVEEPVVTADTAYVVINYDVVSGKSTKGTESVPDKYIGLSRQSLEKEMKLYEESPSLADLEKGFSHMELLSFSNREVVIRKNYEKDEGFFLVNENHYVVVYDGKLRYKYMDTGICTKELPQALKKEIIEMKYIANEQELFHFLESYSS